MIKTYSELRYLKTFEERYEYLKLNGTVGKDTFGYDRYLNQMFYKDDLWLSIRDKIIIRDCGCDLGVKGYDILGSIIIHHMNPITTNDILEHSDFLLNPKYLIATKLSTHNAIHYGSLNSIIKSPTERTKNDTCPWRHH